MTSHTVIESVEVIDQKTTFNLREVCDRGGVHAEFVIQLVDHGIIAPLEDCPPSRWCFDAASLARLSSAMRLQRDLELNLPGVAMSLELLDELRRLRAESERLKQQLKDFV